MRRRRHYTTTPVFLLDRDTFMGPRPKVELPTKQSPDRAFESGKLDEQEQGKMSIRTILALPEEACSVVCKDWNCRLPSVVQEPV